jgi:hypothetical protein
MGNKSLTTQVCDAWQKGSDAKMQGKDIGYCTMIAGNDGFKQKVCQAGFEGAATVDVVCGTAGIGAKRQSAGCVPNTRCKLPGGRVGYCGPSGRICCAPEGSPCVEFKP